MKYNSINITLFYCFLSFLFFFICNIKFSKSQICSPIDYTSLSSNLDFNLLKTNLKDVIKDNIYPLNDLQTLSSSLQNKNPCPFREKVLLKMSRNEKIKVVVIGGSLTGGAELSRNESKWSDHLDKYLNSGWYSPGFDLKNIAYFGWNIEMWSSRVEDLVKFDADLLITDFSMNDMAQPPSAIPNQYELFIQLIETLPSKPALLFNLAFCLLKKEHLTSYGSYGSTKILPLKNTDNYFAFSRFWEMSDFERKTLIKYNIPSVNIRDVMYPDFYFPPEDLIYKWSSFVHPNGLTHKYIADNLFNAIHDMIITSINTDLCSQSEKKYNKNFCNRSLYLETTQLNPKVFPICPYNAQNVVLMEANTNFNSSLSFHMNKSFNSTFNHWKFYADSRNRHGWIYHEQPNTNQYLLSLFDKESNYTTFNANILNFNQINKDYILSFDINVNNSLQLTFLRSYPEMYSNFIFWFDDNIKDIYFITTKWRYRFSLPVTCSVFFKPTKLLEILTPIRFYHLNITSGRHVLNILPAPTLTNFNHGIKVKLMAVKTC